jgi:colicin import membrane protein
MSKPAQSALAIAANAAAARVVVYVPDKPEHAPASAIPWVEMSDSEKIKERERLRKDFMSPAEKQKDDMKFNAARMSRLKADEAKKKLDESVALKKSSKTGAAEAAAAAAAATKVKGAKASAAATASATASATAASAATPANAKSGGAKDGKKAEAAAAPAAAAKKAKK